MKLWCLNNYFSCDPHFVILAWVQSWNIFEKLMKLQCPLEFFHKTCLTNNYFSRDPCFVIRAWDKIEIFLKNSWKCVVNLIFLHKNMSHEQLPFMWWTFHHSSMGTKLKCLWKTHETMKSAWNFSQKHVHELLLFTWSTFHDFSMGTKLKYFSKTNETVKSALIFSQKHVSRTITFHVIHISWFKHKCKVEIFLKYSLKCKVSYNFFKKTCLTNNYFSRDPHYVIQAWQQSWNRFQILMKVCSSLEFFSQTHVSRTITFHMIHIS